jgi:hypothetical protein
MPQNAYETISAPPSAMRALLARPLLCRPMAHDILPMFAVGDRLVHTDSRFAIRKPRKAFLEQFDQQRILANIDIGGHSIGIVLQPKSVH